MPTIHDLKQSRFLTQNDVVAPILVTIKGHSFVNVAAENQSPDEKYILAFQEACKPLVLNYTNGEAIAQINGSEDMDNWAGTKIVLFRDPTIMMGTKKVGGIRVRAPRNQAPPVQATPVAPAPAPETEPPEDDVPF